MLWTAHGVKVWKQPAPVSMSYVFQNARICSAMPPLSYILSDQVLAQLADEVCDLALNYHTTSLSTVRNVRRIPLKPLPLTEDEHIYMSQSLDGLSVFEPVDIYSITFNHMMGLWLLLQNVRPLMASGWHIHIGRNITVCFSWMYLPFGWLFMFYIATPA